MDSIYEFIGKRDKKMIKASVFAYLFKGPRLYILSAALFLLLMMVVVRMVEFKFDDLYAFYISLASAVIVFCFFISFWCIFLIALYKRHVNIIFAREMECSKGQGVEFKATFFEDRIEIYAKKGSDESNSTVLYSQVRRINQNKDYVMVFTKAHQFVSVEKALIVKGNVDTLYNFLQEKRRTFKK